MKQQTMKVADRLTQAKRKLRQVEGAIEAATEQRRAVLLEGAADSPAAIGADRELADLRLLRQRLIDQVDLLPSLVALEQQEARFPRNPAAARALLAEKQARLQMLRPKRWNELDAATSTERDSLPIEIGRLKQAIQSMEQMNA